MLSNEQVSELASRYLLEVGQFLAPDEPKFDEEKRIWIVSVFHQSKVARFEMGEMTLDTEGNVVTLKLLEDSPEIRELERHCYKIRLAEK